jgi:hypothetical protein
MKNYIDEVKKSIDYLSTKPSVKPESLNFNFKIINGDEALMPKTIFDMYIPCEASS